MANYDERQSENAAEDRELLQRLDLQPSHSLADIGCGTGRLACAAARLCREVPAIDISLPMLAATKRTYGWIMEGLIKQAGLMLVSAQYYNGAMPNTSRRAPHD